MNSPPSIDVLMEQGQGLVHSLAVQVHRSAPIRVDLEDLIAYGELGLAQATRDFDVSRGVQFTTFAYHRVRGAIYDGLAQMTWTSRAQYRRLRYQQMAEEVLDDDTQQVGYQPGESLKKGAAWLRRATDKLAAVYLASQGGEGQGIRDSAIIDSAESPQTIIARQEISKKIIELVDELPNIERRLITAVYLDGATLERAGKQLGISKSWASRLHAKALESLARALRKIDAVD